MNKKNTKKIINFLCFGFVSLTIASIGIMSGNCEDLSKDTSQAKIIVIDQNNRAIRIEADYILECQIIDHPTYPQANGAINNVRGYNLNYPQPDFIVPGENAMAILGLITASQVLNLSVYIEQAQLAADYFISVQNPDGSWCNKYDYLNGHDVGESPRHAAQLMMAFYKLGYDPNLYNSMIQASEYLISCFNDNLNLINGGKDEYGVYSNEYWLTDNCFAYHAFMAAYSWALINGNNALALELANYAGSIIEGINTNFKDVNSPVWYERIDQYGNPIENSEYPNWIKYAPLLYNVPVGGVNSPNVGEWIHTTFQQPDGSCIGYVYDNQGNKTNTRKYPGLSFQAALCWQIIGGTQGAYAQDAINWAANSGLWQLEPDPVGVIGGWIDWIEVEPNPGLIAEDWERYIDTSALAIFVLNEGFNFTTASFILHVPQDYPTIQSAIDAAWDSCIVLVTDGIYTGDGNWNINFLGKAITVKSENGAASTIIECDIYMHRGFNFYSQEDESSLLEGFTIRNGFSLEGGGIYCTGASPTIKDCIILNNTAGQYGGGIYCYFASPKIVNCTIKGNRANLYDGGGISCRYGSPVIIDCTIIENTSGNVGGGISCEHSSPTITDCLIKDNQSGTSGGAISCYYESNPIITDCTISANFAVGGAGAALYCGLQSNPSVTNCLIFNNAALSSSSDGGAIYTWNSVPTFYNCTITGNSADRSGGAIGVLGDGAYTPGFTNCILWGNIPNEIYTFFPWSIPVSYSDVQGGYPGTSNIDANPLFVNPDLNHYSLSWNSPCINTGDPQILDPDQTRSNMGVYGGPEAKIVNITLTSDQSQVLPGETLEYVVLLSNNFVDTYRVFVNSELILPNGRIRPGNLGPLAVNLNSYQTFEQQLSFDIPTNAMTGDYIYAGNVQTHEAGLIDESSFDFEVVSGAFFQ